MATVALLTVTPELVADLLRLPSGSRILDAKFDQATQTIELLVSHYTFIDLLPHMKCPRVRVLYREISARYEAAP